MAAIALKRTWLRTACALIFLLAFFGVAGTKADTEADIRSQLSYVATALTAGNPDDAMTPFSKSFAARRQLTDYFHGLTDAFTVRNEVDVLDEENSASEVKATIRWSITLTTQDMNVSQNRSAEIAVRFTREKNKWRIVDFTPIEIFNPATVNNR